MAKRHPTLVPLSQDHHQGLTLALRCRKQALGQLNPGNPDGMKERVDEARDFYLQRLRPHFEAEEKVLFPLIRSHSGESHQILDELLLEHEQIRGLVADLDRDAQQPKVLFDLGDLLERHIRHEERELFPIFEKFVSPEDAENARGEIEKYLYIREHPL